MSVQIAHHKKKHGVISPKRLIGRLRRDNELFRSYMHQASPTCAAMVPIRKQQREESCGGGLFVRIEGRHDPQDHGHAS